ncbi:MAG: iron chelate uptake ABC transporter family permease subunit [Spirochaetaceae bacterium]|nr:iron chelate uptake ABC transporter family permease subunit [Spirochaetaceae bacterium]
MVGRYYIPLSDVPGALFGRTVPPIVEQIIFQVRLPRIFTALMAGSSLSVSGAAFQGMFRNPLISPDLLGASAGAGFGAALGILFSFSLPAVKATAFLIGLGAVFLTWLPGTKIGRGENTRSEHTPPPCAHHGRRDGANLVFGFNQRHDRLGRARDTPSYPYAA